MKIDFKSNKVKTIIIVIAAVTIAGAATIIGITVGNHNNEKTEEMINQAVSSALAAQESTGETTTQETTTESTTEESTATEAIAKVKGRTTTTTTSTTTTTTTTTTAPSHGKKVDYDRKKDYQETKKVEKTIDTNTPIGTVTIIEKEKRKDKDGYYWFLVGDIRYKDDSGRANTLCIDDNYKLFYFDEYENRIYPDF